MSRAQRRYLLFEQGVGAAVFNFLLNAAIAWLIFRGADVVPLWGQQSIAGDTIGTSVILPFLTCLIVFKASFAAAEALVVTPLVALWAIAEGPAAPAPALRAAGSP